VICATEVTEYSVFHISAVNYIRTVSDASCGARLSLWQYICSLSVSVCLSVYFFVKSKILDDGSKVRRFGTRGVITLESPGLD